MSEELNQEQINELENQLNYVSALMQERIIKEQPVKGDSWKFCDIVILRSRLHNCFNKWVSSPLFDESRKNEIQQLVNISNYCFFIITRRIMEVL